VRAVRVRNQVHLTSKQPNQEATNKRSANEASAKQVRMR
jgi:hypothetical protein